MDIKKLLFFTFALATFTTLPESSTGWRNVLITIRSKILKPAPIYIPSATMVRIEEVNNVSDCINLINYIKQAANTSDALLFYINCSGGSTSLYHTLIDVIKKICKDKPNVTYIDHAMSCGYGTAASTDYLVCNPFGLTGSIGVAFKYQPDKKTTIIQEGKYKMCGNELIDEQKDSLRYFSKDQYQKFCKLVAENRNLNIDESDEWAQGKEFTAEEALKLGLVDKVGYLSDAVEALKDKLKEKGLNTDNGINLKLNTQTFESFVV